MAWVPVVAHSAAASRFVYCVLHIKLKPQLVFRFRGETPIHVCTPVKSPPRIVFQIRHANSLTFS